jgi:hypothetical protein
LAAKPTSTVNYACLYVGLLEVWRLLPRYKNQLLFFKCSIDDGIGVWLDTDNDPQAWTSFFHCLNHWGSLKWTCDGHTDDLVFLDLPILITPACQIHFKSYQNMLYSLIFGWLRAYRIQNTNTADYIHMAILLAQHLCAQGYSLELIKPEHVYSCRASV